MLTGPKHTLLYANKKTKIRNLVFYYLLIKQTWKYNELKKTLCTTKTRVSLWIFKLVDYINFFFQSNLREMKGKQVKSSVWYKENTIQSFLKESRYTTASTSRKV